MGKNPVMKISIEEVPFAQKFILRHLMELYQYDFSEISEDDISEQGLFGYKYLDHYWTEERRTPYLIRINSKIAGFAFVNGHLVHLREKNARSLAEFFVLRKYRRQGIGTEVAQRVFSTHAGPWEVTVNDFNKAALAFWRSAISNYTGGQYQEKFLDNSNWKGFVFSFSKDD